MPNQDTPVWLKPGAIVWVGHFFHDSAGNQHAEVEPVRAVESVRALMAREFAIQDSSSRDWSVLPLVSRSHLVHSGLGRTGEAAIFPEALKRWELGFHDERKVRLEEVFPTPEAAIDGFKKRCDYLSYQRLRDEAPKPMPDLLQRSLPPEVDRLREWISPLTNLFPGDFGERALIDDEIEYAEQIVQNQLAYSAEEREDLGLSDELVQQWQQKLTALKQFWLPLTPVAREAVRAYLNREWADIPRLEAAITSMDHPRVIPLPPTKDGFFPGDQMPAMTEGASHRLVVRFFDDISINSHTILRPLVRSYGCRCPRWLQLKVWDELERHNESCVFVGNAEECERARNLWREEEDHYHFDLTIEPFIAP